MLQLLNYFGGRAPYLLLLLLAGRCEAQPKVAPAPPAVRPATSQLLLGQWKSVTDPGFTVTITPTTYVEHYPDSPASTLRYVLTNTCQCDAPAKKTPDKRLLVTYESSPADCYCYSIDQLDASHLVLLYLGRGNRIKFKRVK